MLLKVFIKYIKLYIKHIKFYEMHKLFSFLIFSCVLKNNFISYLLLSAISYAKVLIHSLKWNRPCFCHSELPRWRSGKEPTGQCRRGRRRGFYPWVKKIPWRRTWQHTPVLLPGKFDGQRSLASYTGHGVTDNCDNSAHDGALFIFCHFSTYVLCRCNWG